jgi:hypothetical protein
MNFDHDFAADTNNTIVIWADDLPVLGRIKFLVSGQIQTDHLGITNPVHTEDNIERCMERRDEIEAACERAFKRDPSDCVSLTAADFDDQTAAPI